MRTRSLKAPTTIYYRRNPVDTELNGGSNVCYRDAGRMVCKPSEEGFTFKTNHVEERRGRSERRDLNPERKFRE